MSNIYFASDTHFAHKNIIKFRCKADGSAFTSAQEHDEYVFERLSAKLKPRDSLYLLGDVAFSMDGFEYVKKLHACVAHLHVIIGNHDFERPGSPTMTDYLSEGIKLHAMVKYKGFWLTHAPLHDTELRGCQNIHGHTHAKRIDDGRYHNVCVEATGFEAVDLTYLRERREVVNRLERT